MSKKIDISEKGFGSGLFFSSTLFLLSLIVFLFNFRYIPSGDTLPNELLPLSILTEGNLDFNEFVANPNKLPYYFRFREGRVISSYPIIPGLLNVPVYFAAKCVGEDLLAMKNILSLISSSLIAALSALFMFFSLSRALADRRKAFFFSLVYILGTGVWSVACRGMWQHGPSLLFLTISLFLLLGSSSRETALSGLFLSLAVWNRPTNAVFAFFLLLFVVFHRRKALVGFLLLASIPALGLIGYSLYYWNDAFSLGQAQGRDGFTGSIAAGLAGLLISPSRGLLVFSPVFVFSFIYLFRSLKGSRENPLYAYISWSVIALIFLYAKWTMWWGGWTFGYRLILELVPFLVLFLALFFQAPYGKKGFIRILMWAGIFVSVYMHFLGACVYPSGFNEYPNNVDAHPERLWSLKDSEITRCTEKLLKRATDRFRIKEQGIR